jgi:xanthine dehydrogenase accessory factor
MSTNDWSSPETDVYEQIRETIERGEDAVLATVIGVEGSAYRRPGAKMLIRPDGGGAGSITAGCLEDEVRALAVDVLEEDGPRVETWDLTGDDDVWGLGVGCNGVITVLLEPLDESYRPVVDARLADDSIGVATVVGGDIGAEIGGRAYYQPGAGFDASTEDGGGVLPDAVRDDIDEQARTLVGSGSSETFTVETEDGSVEVFVEGVRAPPELVVFGSGHDIGPVVELAKLADFRVTVVAFRGVAADEERFPRADEVMSASPRDVPDLREWDTDTYAVVMSHNFVDDRLTLDALLDTPVPYIGLMGPDKRFEEMQADFADEGRTLTDSERERIYTPIGLNLGGDTPYQIAFSIVGELLAVAHDRTPEHLSQREGSIHDRADVTVN